MSLAALAFAVVSFWWMHWRRMRPPRIFLARYEARLAEAELAAARGDAEAKTVARRALSWRGPDSTRRASRALNELARP